MEHVRDIISKGASAEQLKYELKVLMREDRQSLLDLACVRDASTVIPPSEVLAMKADLSITWSKLRVLGKWMRVWNISLGTEGKERSHAKEVIGPNLTSESVAFTFSLDGGGEELRKAPMAYVPDLPAKIIQLLDQNERLGRLTTHGDAIPPGEIWIKIGGDKGGKSMKVNFQIMNVPHPNSVINTCVFLAYEGSDTKTNLHVALARYKSQIDTLRQMKWSNSNGTEMSLKILLSGDYEFLCHMYGLSGASGRHCCLWCEIPGDKLVVPREERGRFPPRTLQKLETDHQRFLNDGGGHLKKAKHYNNVITKHFFNIPIDSACPPGLHITLGVFFRLFTLLEDEAHKLDLEMANSTATTASTRDKQPFQDFTAMIRKERELLDQINRYKDELKWLDQTLSLLTLTSTTPASNLPAQAVAKSIVERKKKITATEMELSGLAKKKGFKRKDGPFVQALDQALASFNVYRQAYYGGTFIGNHIHRTLKEVNMKTLCQSMVNVAKDRCPNLTYKANFLEKTFQKAFTYFADCREIYDSAKVLCEQEISALEVRIDGFLGFYREAFPETTVTPKLHMMEDHNYGALLTAVEKRSGFARGTGRRIHTCPIQQHSVQLHQHAQQSSTVGVYLEGTREYC